MKLSLRLLPVRQARSAYRSPQLRGRWKCFSPDWLIRVSRPEAKRYGRIFKLLEGASVLTVGETPGFLESGGAIAFLLEGERLQFDINKSAADDVHLRISSNMLALARRVVVRTETAKS
jgi:hypothetical protein